MILLHALTAQAVPVEELSDTAGFPLEEIPCGRLHSVVARRQSNASVGREEVLAHGRVVDAVSRVTATLPVRYGVVHHRRQRLRQAVVAREARLLRALERVGGQVEFVIRPAEPAWKGHRPREVSREASGRDYLERRLEEERAQASSRAEQEERLNAAVASLERSVTEVLTRRGRTGSERCCLVPRDDAEAFRVEADRVVRAQGDLLLGGPWPPFSFADPGSKG